MREVHSVRYIRWERERERERERYRERERERRKWRHHCRAKIGDEFCASPCQKCAPKYWRRVLRYSSPKNCTSVSPLLNGAEFTLSVAKKRCTFRNSYITIVALTWLAMSFALLLAKNVHLSIDEEFCAIPRQKICTSVSPLLNGAEFTLPLPNNVALFETVRILRTANWRDWQGIEAAKQTMEFPAAPFFLVQISKKWIKLIPKTIGNRKRDCAWGCPWGINTTWENLQIEKHKSGRRSFRSPNWFVLFDLQIFSGGVYSPRATSRTISFSISNSFWY